MYDELTEVAVPEIWAGVDIGKDDHHRVVIDAQGKRLLCRAWVSSGVVPLVGLRPVGAHSRVATGFVIIEVSTDL
ncbi:hypothetical protein [Streptomyces sp. NBC_01462]|uniref:hypothetical protein n=1 Tax=Streptomyces sp. NBC_01462 TaxID=2903876 RepID=UPI002E36D76F|nr:hypothetical protein [Streptomyces sp. NBC_01462]